VTKKKCSKVLCIIRTMYKRDKKHYLMSSYFPACSKMDLEKVCAFLLLLAASAAVVVRPGGLLHCHISLSSLHWISD